MRIIVFFTFYNRMSKVVVSLNQKNGMCSTAANETHYCPNILANNPQHSHMTLPFNSTITSPTIITN
jgi:hypothetical protein